MRRKTTNVQVNDSFNLSISDLMAGLLAVFILILCWYIYTFNSMNQELAGNNQKRKEMLEEIRNEINDNSTIKVFINENNDTLRIPEKAITFPSGSVEIDASGKALVKKLSNTIYKVVTKPKYKGYVETIFIEGHTDGDPVNRFSYYKDNWNLSTARAVYIWQLMEEYNGELDKLKNKNKQKLFSCSGYSDKRKLNEDERTEEDKAKNRRIDIRFTMIPPSGDDSRKSNN